MTLPLSPLVAGFFMPVTGAIAGLAWRTIQRGSHSCVPRESVSFTCAGLQAPV